MPAQTITNANSVPIDTSSPSSPIGKKPGDERGDDSRDDRRDVRRLELRVHLAEDRREQTVARHRVEDARLAHEHHEHDRRETGDGADR